MPGYSSDIQYRYTNQKSGIPILPTMEQPPAPKHIPFPNTPVDDDIFFEYLLCFFSYIAGLLQNLHLYRSVWWLPHSYNNQAMNFYLVDFNLLTFTLIILSRRVVYINVKKILDKVINESSEKTVHFYSRCVIFGIMCAWLGLFAIVVMQKHHLVKILYLCYPMLIYVFLFGFQIKPLLELGDSDVLPPIHACSCNAIKIRKEVENLKQNFNNRMKQIIFNATTNAYYAGFIPCCFAQPSLHYDVAWAAQHVVFIFLSSFIYLSIHMLPLRYCDVLHRSSLHLGSWVKMENRNMLLVNNNWKEDMLWPNGVLVRHRREVFKAIGECNANEPGNSSLQRFYVIFKNPSYLLSVILAVHVLMILYQLVLLLKSIYWYNILSLTFLLFFNYYSLYKLARNYFVSFKIYKDEQEMHNKTLTR